MCEEKDYIQDAYVAYLEFKNKYSPVRNGRRVKMQEETLTYWYIEKAINKKADTNEVAFQVFDKEGNYVQTLSNGKFRKKKRQLEKTGYTWKSIRITESIHKENDGEEYELSLKTEGDEENEKEVTEWEKY